MDYSVDDLVFTGRSVYGFNNLPIIMRWESEHNHGVKIGDAIVPIIPSAAIYDFHDGIKIPKDDWAQRAIDALGGELPLGKEWCGTGATVGKIKGMQYAKPSGQGYSLISKGELKVGVYVVANSLGEVFDLNGNCLSTLNINLESLFNSVIHEDNIINIDSERSLNTTVGTAITNAALTHQQASYIAEAANFGLASRIYPYSTGFDGDTVFAVSTNEVQYPVDEVAYLARIAAEQAIMSIFK
jgi:L-aminopeptidase/D-esterase-like protein